MKAVLSILLIINTLLLAGPARGGILTFTQPDGTQFQGLLKGTSAFNWIQSNGEIIKYNSKDKFYHIAIFDINNTLQLTERVPSHTIRRAPAKGAPSVSHQLQEEQTQKLKQLYLKKRALFTPE